MSTYIFDAEFDGLNPTKVHVFSFVDSGGGEIKSTATYSEMGRLLTEADVLIGHNIIRYDVVHLERILGIKIKAKLVDTLALSWYLEFDRQKHGLEQWGEEFGVPKPEIKDWDNLTYAEYAHRCQADVNINLKLWERLKEKLLKLYGSEEEMWKLVNYLSFKMKCAALQEQSRWRLDVSKCKSGLATLENELASKVDALSKVMPSVPIIKKKTRPKDPFKKDGSLKSYGERWFKLLKERGLPEDYDQTIEVVSGYKEPNPGSSDQVKDWLYSLGWKPETYKFIRNKETGDVRQIPQVNSDDKSEGVCRSVKKLFDKEPALELLDGVGVIKHRIGILKGFLKAVDDEGYVRAEIQGITNTMRFKHAVCVNMPGVDKPYGELIRGVLIADEGYELCGSDMSSLENRVGDHYIWKFDPKYVREKMSGDYDPHLTMCVTAGLLEQEDMDYYQGVKSGKFCDVDGRYKKIHEVRKTGKVAVYASAYGAGAKTIARQANISVSDAKKLHEAYWKINWAMRAVPKTIKIKKEFGSMWLLNPVSKLWYSLRNEKDVWNTLVQGTGAYCFDVWVSFILSKREQLTANFHDEVILHIKKGHREPCERLLRWAIKKTNEKLKLNRALDVDVEFGGNYSEIH